MDIVVLIVSKRRYRINYRNRNTMEAVVANKDALEKFALVIQVDAGFPR